MLDNQHNFLFLTILTKYCLCITFLCVPLHYQNKQTMKTTNNIEKELEVVLLGFTEEITDCACCGKSDLKGTYALQINGDITYFGSVCAFKLHGVSYDAQKQIKSEKKSRVKAEDKLKEMESENRTDAYWITKMLKFVESKPKSLNLNEFILKYGKVFEDAKHYTAYQVGNVVKIVNK